MKLQLSIFVLCFAFVLASAQTTEPIWPDGKVPYSLPIDVETGSPALDLYLTKEQGDHTGAAVVICPGGGYGGLAADHEGHQPAEWFAEQGVTAFVLKYRLGPEGHHYPTQLADVQRAIRWVRARDEEYDIDASRIAVMGFSAGGHLASMASTLFEEKVYEPTDAIDKISARPDFSILCYPVISLESEITHSGSRKNLLGPDKVDDDALAQQLSSDRNVTAETPPTFLFQTNADTAVPAENAARYFLALRRNGVPVEFHCYQNGPHGVGLYRGDPVVGTWSGLLTNWLRANSFFAPAVERVAVSGEVTIDGEPVSWGVISFHPEDEGLPVTSVRARKGKFSAKTAEGPVVGKVKIRVEGSLFDETDRNQNRRVLLDSLKPGGKPIELKLEEGMNALSMDFVTE